MPDLSKLSSIVQLEFVISL